MIRFLLRGLAALCAAVGLRGLSDVLRLAAAELAAGAGRLDEADALAERVSTTASPVLRIAALGLRTQVAISGPAAGAAGERIAEVMALLRDTPDEALEGAGTLVSDVGALAYALGRYEDAERAWEQALRLARQHDDVEAEAAAAGNLVVLASRRGQGDRAVGLARRCVDRYREMEREEALAQALANLGTALLAMGRLDEAEPTLEESVALAAGRGEDGTRALATGNLGTLYLRRGELVQAEEAYRRALALREASGPPEDAGAVRSNLASLLCTRGALDEAERHLRAVIDALDPERRPTFAGLARCNLARVLRLRGALDEARRLHDAGRALLERSEARTLLGEELVESSVLHQAAGDDARAVQDANRAEAALVVAGSPPTRWVARLQLQLARARAGGAVDAAAVDEAVAALREAGEPLRLAEGLVRVAEMAPQLGAVGDAARVEARALVERLGLGPDAELCRRASW